MNRPVRLRQAWQCWPKGHIFTEMPAAQAQHMVAAGQAEYIDAPTIYPHVSMQTPPADRMMRSHRRRRQVQGDLITNNAQAAE